MKKSILLTTAIAGIILFNSCSQTNSDEGQSNVINSDSTSLVKSAENMQSATETEVAVNDSISKVPEKNQSVTEKIKVQTQSTNTNNTVTSTNSTVSGGCVEGDCTNGAGKYIFDNGDKFNGYWKEGIRNDYGRYDYKNGDWYLGDFKNDKIEGKGVYHSASGKTVSGEWVNNELVKVDKPEDSASLHMKLPQLQMKK